MHDVPLPGLDKDRSKQLSEKRVLPSQSRQSRRSKSVEYIRSSLKEPRHDWEPADLVRYPSTRRVH